LLCAQAWLLENIAEEDHEVLKCSALPLLERLAMALSAVARSPTEAAMLQAVQRQRFKLLGRCAPGSLAAAQVSARWLHQAYVQQDEVCPE
jgi:hypothetical protein